MRYAFMLVALGLIVSTTLRAADQRSELPPAKQRDIKKLAGTRPPPPARLKMLIQQQRTKANRVRETLGEKPAPAAPAAGEAPAPAPAPATDLPRRFDWTDNDKNAVTEVKDQGDCGSCWAFATTAALESNFLLPGHSAQKVNASEKSVLDCVPTYSCDGGWWDEPFNLMWYRGIADETDYPYPAHPMKEPCKMDLDPNIKPMYRIINWDYVEADPATLIPTNDAMKKALMEHGPIVIAFNATSNFVKWDPNVAPVFKENDPGDINHAMLLVGWDDDKEGGAWHIKNSWRDDWGDKGFAWVGYGTNKVGYAAAWVDTTHASPPPDPDKFNAVQNEVQKETKQEQEAATKPAGSAAPNR
jgi:C1A family cysteine protease